MSSPVTGPDAPPAAADDDRARRVRLLALLGVLALLAVAFAVGTRSPEPAAPDAREQDAEVAALREAADLGPCPPGLGADVPDLVLPCLSGGDDVAIAEAPPGRPTLVNVWGSWCAPCVREVPLLADFAQRAGDDVALVGVLTQDSLRSALTFARESGMDWPSVVDDDGAVMRAFSPGPPVTLFVTADGRVAHVVRGEFTDVAQIEALVAEHLGVVL